MIHDPDENETATVSETATVVHGEMGASTTWTWTPSVTRGALPESTQT